MNVVTLFLSSVLTTIAAGQCGTGDDEACFLQVKTDIQHGHERFNTTYTRMQPVWQPGAHARITVLMSSIDHCLQKRGLNMNDLAKREKNTFNVFMHSGTAVNWYGCRSELNDIDLWIPLIQRLLPNKNNLAEAYASGAVQWEGKPGMTDKNKAELDDQIYCPTEVGEVKGRSTRWNEVDAFVGVGAKFDTGKFMGIATNAVNLETAELVQHAVGFEFYAIGVCNLIQLKLALINGGRNKPKASDNEDIECLCAAYNQPAFLREHGVENPDLCHDQCALYHKNRKGL